MPRTVNYHTLQKLSADSDEIILETTLKTELHIKAQGDRTTIRLPFGNKFDLIDGVIIIHDK